MKLQVWMRKGGSKRLETAEAISRVIVIGRSPNCKEQKILKKSSEHRLWTVVGLRGDVHHVSGWGTM